MLPTIFNCSNDMALAANVTQYLPPKRIQQMEEDLADICHYWKEGPWGWSRATKQRYKHMGVAESDLPTDEWLDEVRRLSSRQFACEYIHDLLAEASHAGTSVLGDRNLADVLVGADMRYLESVETDASLPAIFKSPWSSSGRGVFVCNEMDEKTITRLKGYIHNQGGYVADTFYEDKAVDFAMEFMVHADHRVDFLGYSVFETATGGAYGYNYVESQDKLKARIGADARLLDWLIDYHIAHLSTIDYHGPVGIDMIRLMDGRVHPVIEINMRMNMGILALNMYDKIVVEGLQQPIYLTPQCEDGFSAKVEDGKLMISPPRRLPLQPKC